MSSPIQEGTTVILKDTVSVRQRFQFLVGATATVVSSPVHPNTWFTLLTQDGKHVKVQSNAICVLNQLGEEEICSTRSQENRWSLGHRVMIRNIPNTHLNKPPYVGKKGTIVELPRHPNTWYGVKMDKDGLILKFQSSSLELISIDKKRDISPSDSKISNSVTLGRVVVI